MPGHHTGHLGPCEFFHTGIHNTCYLKFLIAFSGFEYFSQFWTPRRRWRSAVSRTMVRLSGDVIPPPVLQLVTQLRSGTDADKNMASAKIGRLLTTGKRAARDFLKAGVVPVLVTLARNGSGLQKQNAAGALALLSRYEETRDAIVAAGGVNPIVALLRSSPRLQRLMYTLHRITVAVSCLWYRRVRTHTSAVLRLL